MAGQRTRYKPYASNTRPNATRTCSSVNPVRLATGRATAFPTAPRRR